MKYIKFILVFIVSLSISLCTSKSSQVKNNSILNEDAAISQVSQKLYLKKNSFVKKKLGVYHFSNLEGKVTIEGKRLSKKLLEKMLQLGDLIFIERSELESILKEQGLEQTGIIDTEAISDDKKILPVDVLINGTIAQIENHGELSVKAVNIKTGEIYSIVTVDFFPKGGFSYKESSESLKLHKKSPLQLEIINKTFNTLLYLNKKHPALFLMASYQKNDPVLRRYPKILKKLKKVAMNIRKNKPQKWKKFMSLRKGVNIIYKLDNKKFNKITDLKKRTAAKINRKL